MSEYHVTEAEDFLREKGKDITREESFTLYGYITGLYIAHKLTVDEYAYLMDKIPVDNKELEAVNL